LAAWPIIGKGPFLFQFESIAHYHGQLGEGIVSCVDTVKHYLAKIEASSELNAYVHVFGEEALERAAILDQQRSDGRPIGRLHGVIIAIKDVICYKGHPVAAASGILDGFNSLFSATAVERLLAEEAIIIGSTNCDEFAMGSSNENSFYGRVLNADDHGRVPGGSSGGSAVAVQADLCMASLGTDTGGSVRQPADFCGIIGLKPSYGRISRHGLIAYASSFDQIGIFSKQVDDTGLLLEIMSGKDEYDSTVSDRAVPPFSNIPEDRKFKLAYFKEALSHPSLDPEMGQSIKDSLAELESAGHLVNAISFNLLDFIVPAYYVLTTAEASSNLSRFDGVRYGNRSEKKESELTDFYMANRSEGFGLEVKRRILLGTFVLSTGYFDAYFTKAQQVRRMIQKKLNDIFSEYDAIIMPTSPTTAFKFGEKTEDPVSMYLADIYTVMANLAGLPAISLPLYRHTNGMAFGMQAMTNQFDELSLLVLARQLMRKSRVEA